jgi:hypothetical protein
MPPNHEFSTLITKNIHLCARSNTFSVCTLEAIFFFFSFLEMLLDICMTAARSHTVATTDTLDSRLHLCIRFHVPETMHVQNEALSR